ncbi:hypothetical protein AHAS_Ahas04G0070300 [Arachis hypogaea]
MPIPSYNSRKDGSSKGKDSGQGSRFDILHEENLGNVQDIMEGKNPQTLKKPVSTPRALLEQGGIPNQNRNKAKNSESALATPKGVETPSRAMKGKDKDPDLEGMEMVVKEYIRRMEKDQWEAFKSLKDARMNLHPHAVRDNILFSSEDNTKPPRTRLGAPDPRGSLGMQAEITMVEARDRG